MRRTIAVLAVACLALTLAGTASAARYIVVFKPGSSGQGVRAVKAAGGNVVSINKLGVGTVRSTRTGFLQQLRASGRVVAAAPNAAFRESSARATRTPQVAELTPGQAITGCDTLFSPPSGTVGPDPFNVCQWGNRAVRATIGGGSYGFNQGDGVKVGIIDTGLDLNHPDLRANIDVGLSCSFIRPNNPTAAPGESDPTNFGSDPNGPFRGACATKSAVQDRAGHGTHVGGIVAAPINGIGVSGVAPRATLVGLKAGTQQGYFFTQEVVDALVYAGDKRLDVVNMSFFADPWLFNCKNDADQKAIVQAISRASRYAAQRGVVQVASAGNEATDLDHPDEDTISPDFPPGAEQPRPVGNNCMVLPDELPDVATITALGPKLILASYSSVSNSKVENTAPGGDAVQTNGSTFGRILSTYSSTAAALPASRRIDDCTGSVCAVYGWLSGTSMASPYAAGVAALIRHSHPGMPPAAVVATLQNTAQPMACTEEAESYTGRNCTGSTNLGSNGQTNFYGNGLVDALAAGTK
jgi:lantibiotic leader peptide-processing serine protease